MYRSSVRPLLFRVGAESAHDLTLAVLSRLGPGAAALAPGGTVADLRLRQSLWGLTFPNPVGLAAGLDKGAVAVRALYALGFGSVEVGTVTALAQPGNDRPRLFRLPEDGALVNRFGFNNPGAKAVAERLRRARMAVTGARLPGPLGVNLGKSKLVDVSEAAADYVASFRMLAPWADYVTVNVSSPNTPGLRGLQDRDALIGLLTAIQAENAALSVARPLLLKIAPDLTDGQLDDVVRVATDLRLSGLIATNTTTDRPDTLRGEARTETGGLSGEPLRRRATEVVRHLYRATGGSLPIVGVGGVFTAEDALEKLRAGASLVQIYTGFVYGGPGIVGEINRGLLRLMARDGVSRVADLVGSAA